MRTLPLIAALALSTAALVACDKEPKVEPAPPPATTEPAPPPATTTPMAPDASASMPASSASEPASGAMEPAKPASAS